MAGNIINLILRDIAAMLSESNFQAFSAVMCFPFSALMASVNRFISLVFLLVPLFAYINQSFGLEEKYRTGVFLNSLPIRRKNIVFARYFGSMAIACTHIAFVFIGNILFFPFGPINDQPLSPVYFIVVLLLVSFITSVYFPFYFRMGIVKAKNIASFLMFAIMGCFVIMANAYDNGTGFIMTVHSIFSGNISLTILMLLIISTIVLLSVSIPLTVALYSRKDL